MEFLVIFLLVNVVVLYFICYRQRKKSEFQDHRIDQLLLKLDDFVEKE